MTVSAPPATTAQAYVIAHEVGHHVQNVTGQMDRVQAARRRAGEAEANELSVRLELQADCYAGIWAHALEQARQWFEPGDLQEALGAAAAVGDDHIQRSTRGVVVPESFTHGSSAQRVRWFQTGAAERRRRAVRHLQRAQPLKFPFFETLVPGLLPPPAARRSGPPPALLAFYWHFIRQARGVFAAMFATSLGIALLDTLMPVLIGRLVALVEAPDRQAALAAAWPTLLGIGAGDPGRPAAGDPARQPRCATAP